MVYLPPTDPQIRPAVSEDVSVRVGGETFTGWTGVTIQRGLEALAARVTLQTHPTLVRPFPIVPGDSLDVLVGAEQIVTGAIVDGLEAEVDPAGSSLTISARDQTAELVDSSTADTPSELRNVKLLELARILAAPFGVQVRSELTALEEGDAFELWRLQPGESPWAALERALRQRGALGITTPAGELLVTRPGENAADVRLVEGVNVKSTKLSYSHAERFGVYIAQGQDSDGEGSAALLAEVEARAIDPEIDRPRSLVVLAEGAVDEEDVRRRAEWEAIVRAARSAVLEVVVAGFRQEVGGRPWTVNERVRVEIASLQIEARMLVETVTFQRARHDDLAESFTTLRLVREDAYRPVGSVAPSENPFRALLARRQP